MSTTPPSLPTSVADVDLVVVLAALRAEIAERTVDIHRLIRDACPAGKRKHRYIQHRDGRVPWCPHCGYTALGTLAGTDPSVRGKV